MKVRTFLSNARCTAAPAVHISTQDVLERRCHLQWHFSPVCSYEELLRNNMTLTCAGDSASSLEMSLHVFCPKVGLQLSTGEEWLALTPRVPGSPFHTLEAAVREVRLNLPTAGKAHPETHWHFHKAGPKLPREALMHENLSLPGLSR